MKKRELNKKLKSKILTVEDSHSIKHVKFRVIRARESKKENGRFIWTDIDIRISAIVLTSADEWLPLGEFGPRHIRKFLRRHNNNVPDTVNSWTKLWGFPSDQDITIKTIELVNNPCKV